MAGFGKKYGTQNRSHDCIFVSLIGSINFLSDLSVSLILHSVIFMTATEKYLVDTYSNLFEGLDRLTKIELLEKLANSLKRSNKKKATDFYKSFGAFGSDETPEKIIAEIKESRKFNRENMSL